MSFTVTPSKPRFLSIRQAIEYSGRSRSALYEEAGRHRGLFVKDGRRVRVSVELLDELLDKLPAAKIAFPRRRRA